METEQTSDKRLGEVKIEKNQEDEVRDAPGIDSAAEPIMNGTRGEEEEMKARRNRARAQFKKEEEDEILSQVVMDNIFSDGENEEIEDVKKGSSSNEESDEYSTVSEDSGDEEDWDSRRDEIQPIFIAASERETKIEQAKREMKKQKEIEFEEKRKEEKKRTTLQLVEREIKQDLEEEKCIDDEEPETVDDPTNPDEEMREYEAWKVREMARIRKAQTEKEQYNEEQKEKERRSKMSDSEIRALDSGSEKFVKKKSSMKFLQKYYHKGAFFSGYGWGGNSSWCVCTNRLLTSSLFWYIPRFAFVLSKDIFVFILFLDVSICSYLEFGFCYEFCFSSAEK